MPIRQNFHPWPPDHGHLNRRPNLHSIDGRSPRYCPVHAVGLGEAVDYGRTGRLVMDMQEETVRRIVGGVDTHKDLHVAAVVDEQDRVLGTQSFASTRQGYRQMLAWMRSFGNVERVGVRST